MFDLNSVGLDDLLMFFILSTFGILILLELKKINNLFFNQLHSNLSQIADEHVERELTEYEKEIAERDANFEQRITRLKEEVANNVVVHHISTPAEELHPDVHNLPHDSVQSRYDLPSYVEVAE